MNIQEEALLMHEKLKGKLDIVSKMPLDSRKALSLAYTPGVAEPCRHIAKNKEDVYKYTWKGNTVAVVSDGSAVLGLGNIGPEAGLPVMEGKAAIFKEFAGVNAVPIVLAKQDIALTIATVRNIAPGFGGINLEDFKAPECFEIEAGLQDLGIPVMHDDQHGTAVVVLAGLINALKVVNKKMTDINVVVNGAGAAGLAVITLLMHSGVQGKHVVMCDTKGIIYAGREDLAANAYKNKIAGITNIEKRKGQLADAIKGADVFIGLSVKGALSVDMAKTMAKGAIVFAMANPDPEILPDDAKKAGVAVIATGRSDFPNQVNNSLGFPGIFRGALDCRATRITTDMKVAASHAIADLIKNPTAEEILPYTLDKNVVPAVAEAVKMAWKARDK